MELNFYKYQGAGNDFILVDNRKNELNLTPLQIERLCNRHFGIGADGMMLLGNCTDADFEMLYFNSDGHESTMCGNGGRCIAAFAYQIGAAEKQMNFKAIDGMHMALIHQDNLVDLHMQNVDHIEFGNGFAILNTGSPHYISWVDDVQLVDVVQTGRGIRNRDEFQPKGINVNFATRGKDSILIRTYERGVEDETLACGTGVTAAAIVSVGTQIGHFKIPVVASGGSLWVSFEKDKENSAQNIILTGRADFVFAGSIDI